MKRKYFFIFLIIVINFLFLKSAMASDIKLIPDMTKYDPEFWRVVTNKDNSNFLIELKGSNNTDSFVSFRNQIIGPAQANSYQYSEDGKTVLVFDPYKNLLYKNNQKLNLFSDYSGFSFEPKTGQVAFLSKENDKEYLVINDNKKVELPVTLSHSISSNFEKIFKFSQNGKSYALISTIYNPDYQIQVQKITDKYQDLTLKLNKDFENIDKKDTSALEAIYLKLQKIEEDELAEKVKLEDSFKNSWIYKNQLIVDGAVKKEAENIYNLLFTSRGDLAYIFSKNDKSYLVLGKKEIDLGSSKDMAIDSLIISPDANHYSFITYNTAILSSDRQITIDGKKSEVYKKISSKSVYSNTPVIFSPDSKHSAYAASLDGKKWFVVYDGKKSEAFDAGDFGGRGLEAWIKFSSDNKLYFIASQNKQDCIFINNKKDKCVNGQINPDGSTWEYLKFSKDGKVYSYNAKIKEKNTSGNYIFLNNKKFGPYDSFSYNYLISSDGRKVAYRSSNKLYLNGNILVNNFGDYRHDDTFWFTKDSKLFDRYSKSNGKYVLENENKKIVNNSTIPDYSVYVSKDGYSLWQFYLKDNALFWRNTLIK